MKKFLQGMLLIVLLAANVALFILSPQKPQNDVHQSHIVDMRYVNAIGNTVVPQRIIIGYKAQSDYPRTIVIGDYAKATKENQLVIRFDDGSLLSIDLPTDTWIDLQEPILKKEE